jgi:RNA polymerase sigma-70 factor (ECF subfamily)
MAAPAIDDKSPVQFQATRWSVVLAARERQTPEGEAALSWLCERYWHPLRTWAQAKGLSPADAEDLVQGFFEQALKGGLVGRAEASRGRFRSFLLSCLENYWTGLRRRSSAQKRGGGVTVLSLNEPSAEPETGAEIAAGRTPEQEYDRAWARAVLERATDRLTKECDGDGHGGRFAVLRVFLDGDKGEMPLSGAAETLRLSVGAVKAAVYRLRHRMGELVRAEIIETVQTPGDVETELRELFCALRS